MPTKHGHRRASATSSTWLSWRAMVERCTNRRAADYPRYGGRGITVCARWRGSFVAFLADMGERPEGTTLERVHVDGSYEPSNCRWATAKEQSRNKRTTRLITHDGRTQSLVEWAEETGIGRSTIMWRLNQDWPAELALSAEPMSREERGLLGLKSRGVI